MDNLFHENVEDDFVEYFLFDLENNLKQLNELLTSLSRETSYESRMAIDNRLLYLIETINEETEMYEQLYNFRILTPAEAEIVRKIQKLRNTEYIKIYEKAVK